MQEELNLFKIAQEQLDIAAKRLAQDPAFTSASAGRSGSDRLHSRAHGRRRDPHLRGLPGAVQRLVRTDQGRNRATIPM